MSLEGVYDVPMYSAPTEAVDLWSELEGAAWSEGDQQNQFQTQVQQWYQPSQLHQTPQHVFAWPSAAPVQEYAAMSLKPEQNHIQIPWTSSTSSAMPAVSAPGDWHQNAQPLHTSKSPTLPVNYTNATSTPLYHSNAANVPVYHNDAASLAVHLNNGATFPVHPNPWNVGPTQALSGSAWYRRTPITGDTLIQSLPGNQMKPSQAFQNSIGNSIDNAASPRFRITITPNRTVKKVAKRKRVRTAFTTDQILALEKVFSTQTYVSKDERQTLSEKLKISDRAIKVWFQNRRMKGKRESQVTECSDEYEPESTEPELTEACPEPSTSSDSYGSPSSELDYIESQIKRTDERGFVTLDDKALDSLLNVISAFVPKTVELIKKESVPNKEVIYSPISLADTTNSTADEVEPYKPPTDERELQKLFDRHFC